MNSISILLRKERPEEFRAVEEMVRNVFWDIYEPGAVEHYLVHTLRTAEVLVPELTLAAEVNGEIAGVIYYTKAKISGDSGEIPVLTFGPLAVASAMQKQGVGSRLVTETARLAREAGHRAVLIYGNPAYYSRFGFEPGEKYGIADMEGNFCDALQVLVLNGDPAELRGKFEEGDAFHLDPAAVKAFDAGFPPRKKHKLPTQIFDGPPD